MGMSISKEAIGEGVCVAVGAIGVGFAGKYLPSFKFSTIIYGAVGLLIVIVAVGHGLGNVYLRGIALGAGAGLATNLLPGIQGLIAKPAGT